MILRFMVLVVLAAAWVVAPTTVGQAADDAYMLNRGDVVEVTVWREETLAKQLVVLPDGSFSFPLIGRIVGAGRTVTDVEAEIAEKLKPYISDPVVTLSVIGIEGNRVYVIGKVRNPGAFVMSQPLSVMQLLSLAGGFDRFADTNSVQILRGGGTEQKMIHFNYDFVENGSELSMNIELKAGDVVVVP